jgi:hypothetical protein
MLFYYARFYGRATCPQLLGVSVEQPVLSCSGFCAANRENIAGGVAGDGGVA